MAEEWGWEFGADVLWGCGVALPPELLFEPLPPPVAPVDPPLESSFLVDDVACEIADDSTSRQSEYSSTSVGRWLYALRSSLSE